MSEINAATPASSANSPPNVAIEKSSTMLDTEALLQEDNYTKIATDAVSMGQKSLIAESACDTLYNEQTLSSSSSLLTLTTPHNSLADDLNHDLSHDDTPYAGAQQIDDATLIRKLSVHQIKNALNDDDGNTEQIADNMTEISDMSVHSDVTCDTPTIEPTKIDHQNNDISNNNADIEKEDESNSPGLVNDNMAVEEILTPSGASEEIITPEKVIIEAIGGSNTLHTKIFAEDLTEILISEPEGDVESHHRVEQSKEGDAVADEILVILNSATATSAPMSKDATASAFYDEVAINPDDSLDMIVRETSPKPENQSSEQVERTRLEHLEQVIKNNADSFHVELETQLIQEATTSVHDIELFDDIGQEVQSTVYGHVDKKQAVRNSLPVEINGHQIEIHAVEDLKIEDLIRESALTANLEHSDEIEEISTKEDEQQEQQQQEVDKEQEIHRTVKECTKQQQYQEKNEDTELFLNNKNNQNENDTAESKIVLNDQEQEQSEENEKQKRTQEISHIEPQIQKLTKISESRSTNSHQEESQQEKYDFYHDQQKEEMNEQKTDRTTIKPQSNVEEVDKHKCESEIVSSTSIDDFEVKSTDARIDNTMIPPLMDETAFAVYNGQPHTKTIVEEPTMQQLLTALDVKKPLEQDVPSEMKILVDLTSPPQMPLSDNVLRVANVNLPDTKSIVYIQQDEATRTIDSTSKDNDNNNLQEHHKEVQHEKSQQKKDQEPVQCHNASPETQVLNPDNVLKSKLKEDIEITTNTNDTPQQSQEQQHPLQQETGEVTQEKQKHQEETVARKTQVKAVDMSNKRTSNGSVGDVLRKRCTIL